MLEKSRNESLKYLLGPVGRQYQLTKVLCEKRQVNLVNITSGMRIRVSKFSFLGPRYNNTCPEN